MSISSFVSPTPVGFSCIRTDSGECKQFLAYQLIDITYNHGFDKLVESETERVRTAMQREAERLAAIGEGSSVPPSVAPTAPCCAPNDPGFQ
jgi:hypothetical protein